MIKHGANVSLANSGVYDENLTYDNTNISAQFPNANNTGIDSTGNVLTATADGGEAISILKAQGSANINDIFNDGSIIDTYQLNGNMNSLSGVNNGTGSLNSYSSGRFGQAGVFNTTLHQTILPITYEDMSSLSLSYKIDDMSAGVFSIYGSDMSPTRNYLLIYPSDINLVVDGVNIVISTTTVAGEWYHICITKDGLNIRVYINGVLSDTSTESGTAYTQQIELGGYSNSASYGSGKNIDQVRVFSRPLTQEEVITLYTEAQTDFVGLSSEVVPFQGKYEFANISEATIANTLVTSTPIADGDNLVIVKDDDSVNEIVASGVVDIVVPPSDIDGASYDSVSFSVASQDSIPRYVAFNTDGTKMYIVGAINDLVFQYSLSNGFDLSTASYDSVSFDVTSQDTTLLTLDFNDDGTKMYIIGGANDLVYQYSLSTAFDLSTVSYDSVSFSPTSQDANPRGITFNTDGTKMYIVGGASDSVYQYSLSNGFDLSTTSYDSISFSVNAQDANPIGITFNNDGTKMYIVGVSSDSVHQYSLSTAFDLSTASYDSVLFNLSSQDTEPYGINFNTNGTKMYMAGINQYSVYQYSVNGSINETTNYQLDTTPTTQGEIPSKVYAVDSKAEFEIGGGFIEAEKSGDAWDYGDNLDVDDIFGDGSIIATYQFNGDITSLSSEEDCTGTLSTFQSGKFGQSGSFSTTFGEMVTPFTDDNVRTLSMWIYIPDATTLDRVLGSSTATVPLTHLNAQSTKLYVYLGGEYTIMEYGVYGINSTNGGNKDEWIHIIATCNGTNWTYYANDAQVAIDTGTFASSSQPFCFGQYTNTSGDCNNVLVDQTRFFNRGINSDEAHALFAEGVSRFKSTRSYKDLTTDPSQTLQSKITLKAEGDKMTELTASINKEA